MAAANDARVLLKLPSELLDRMRARTRVEGLSTTEGIRRAMTAYVGDRMPPADAPRTVQAKPLDRTEVEPNFKGGKR